MVLEIYLKLRQDKFILRYIFYNEWLLPIFATSRNTQLSFNSQVSCHSLVNKDEINNILCLYFSKSVITFDRLGRCFPFVYIYACILLCCSVLLPFLGHRRLGCGKDLGFG